MHCRLLHPGQDILGPALTIYSSQPTTLPSAFNIMSPQDPTWHMDTSASSHLNFNASNLSTIFDKRLFPSVYVGDGKSIPVTNTGHSIIPSHYRPLHLHNVLVTSNIIKNLISVRQFTRDNNCTIKFDAFGLSVKDYLTRHILLRCDSSGDLYPVTKPSTSPIAFLSTSASTWHQRLGHPGDQVLRSLVSSRFISCNKEKTSHICHACQLGKHVKLPFHSSDSIVEHRFDIIHSDLWTSPIISSSGFKYYVLFLDHFSHYLWIYPLRSKSDMPAGVNMVRSMWLFKHKFHVDGTLSRYKARLVANGSIQQLGVDFDETFRLLGSLNNEFDMTDLGALNYFLGISADRTPTVQQICLYMHDLREPHFAALKYILRYVRGTVDFGLQLYVSATTSLVGYTDTDWAGFPSTRSAEAKYHGVVNVVAKTTWIRNLLPAHVRVLHVPSHFQYVDIFTKGLPTALFKDFFSSLSVCPPLAQSVGGVLVGNYQSIN
ncbi:ribonuclease H-like domain-containing protein [Tanacetum coccineum]